MAPNTALAAHLADTGLTEAEFAAGINIAIGRLTGRRGALTDRSVRRWLSGEVTWPQAKQRIALTTVASKSPEDLGFVRRGKSSNPAPPGGSRAAPHLHRDHYQHSGRVPGDRDQPDSPHRTVGR